MKEFVNFTSRNVKELDGSVPILSIGTYLPTIPNYKKELDTILCPILIQLTSAANTCIPLCDERRNHEIFWRHFCVVRIFTSCIYNHKEAKHKL